MIEDVAIIVPAYKPRFLAATLASVEKQSTPNTRVYVLDDCGPSQIQDIARVALFPHWSYKRFETNLGGTALTRHYDRCVRETREEWIWLFSDDDIMEEECVSALQETIRQTEGRYDVYCFDSVEINAENEIVALHPILPEWEGWKQFAYFFFRGGRMVPQQAMVFSRAAYERLGAFINFPLAWISDQATHMALAGNRGIKRIPGPKIRFRKSGENISSVISTDASSKKTQAAMQFILWFLQQSQKEPDPTFTLTETALKTAAFDWFKRHLKDLHTWYSPKECLQVARFLTSVTNESYIRSLARIVRLNSGIVPDVVRESLRVKK